jgi:nitrate reductase (cytochrome), electron transfer subunit
MQHSHPPDSHEALPRDATAIMPGILQRYVVLFVVIALGITLVGFLRGINEPLPLEKTRAEASINLSDVPEAVTYSELPNAKLKANSGWYSDLSKLSFAKPGPFDPVIRTDEMKQVALADRARNRAYDSAPPVIPHAINQPQVSNCLACHAEGIKVGDRIATKVSHPHYTNCTQCHVEENRSESALVRHFLSENDFEGTKRAGPGTRAWPGAPPTIPHTTWMRQDCTSCHGLVARAGIRTTHPWLTNCTQCHAPSALLDQVDFQKGQP